MLYVRSADSEKRKISEPSEGTRHQLFLAMRLAPLADWAGHASLPPVVAGDLLPTFDDDSTPNTLNEFAGFSSHGQVIVLTNHRHVVDLARRTLAHNVHDCDSQRMAS